MQIQELFTREKHNEGIRVDIKSEDGKTVVGWLQVRGLDSDAYRAASDIFNREMARLAAAVRAKADAPLLAATQAEKDAAQLAARVALVAAWSFENPCTPDNVTMLLREAPYISDSIYFVANDRDRFLGKRSPTSTNGQDTSSDVSAPQQQDQTTV